MAIQPDNKILVGGGFTTIAGASQAYLARLNPDGTRDTNFTATANGAVTCIQLQPDGKIVVGGYFTQINGGALLRLARLNIDGTLDTNFIASADNTVLCLALQPDGKILAGGRFTKINNSSRAAIARLNPDGTWDSSFSPVVSASAYVNTLLVQSDGKIVAGGSAVLGPLSPIGGSYYGLARFTSTGANDPMPAVYSTVNALALQADGELLVGVAASSSALIRITTNATIDSTFQATNVSSISSIQPLADGSSLVAVQPGVLHVNAIGVVDTNFNSYASSAAYALAVQADGKILVAGAFTSIAHTSRSFFARLNNPTAAGSFLTSDGNLNLQWARYGASSEAQRVNFFMTTDGTNWTDLGAATRFGSAGWTLPNPSIRNAIQIRGRAFVSGGTYNGSSSQLDTVAVTGATTITSQPVSRTNSFGGTAQFAISGSGAAASFQWCKNGNALTNDARTSGTQSPVLIINNCSGADNGTYFVVLSNSLGTVTSSNATLSVSDPVITAVTSPGNYRDAGETATLAVSAVGTALTYKWSLNGSVIATATNSSLILTNITGADSGTYNVVVSSPYASVGSLVAVMRVTDPYINVQPANTAWNYGQAGAVSVSVGGWSPISYQWRKNTLYIPDATNSTFVVPSAHLSDAGSYDVIIRNKYGAVGSATAVVSINMATLDNYNPGVGYQMTVYGLAVDPATNVLAGGTINVSQYAGTNFLWRLNRNGTVDSTFVSNAANAKLYGVKAIGVELSGTMLAAGGDNVGFVERLDSLGTPAGSLAATAMGGGTYVWALCHQGDGSIIAAGWFTNLQNEAHSYLARFYPDGSIDHFFTPYADNVINTVAMQPDGKILVGGQFRHLNGQPASFIGRLNSDGTLDSTFNGSAYKLDILGGVNCMAVQPDGKIIVGGLFTNLSAHACMNLGRLNPDGNFDNTFYGNAPALVSSLSLEANGKVFVGGGYYTSQGSPVNAMALVDSSGIVDTTFSPNPNAEVRGIALQSDGAVIIAGLFTNVAGATRIGLARLSNPTPATESFAFDGSTVTWLRGGGAPEVWRTTFEISDDGANWSSLGDGTRINGGWQISNVPIMQPSTIRARGYFNSGYWNGSESIVESRLVISGDRTPPIFSSADGVALTQNGFGFRVAGLPGQLVVVDRSIDLVNWQPIATNLLSNEPFLFTDPVVSTDTNRFYRLRLP